MSMSPGTYLRKRREAAGLDIAALAWRIAALPGARRAITPADLAELRRRVIAAEADKDNLTVLQASLLARAFPLSVAVYEQLLLRHWTGDDGGMPEPRLCRRCACSWHDACRTDRGPCAWSADPTLCTACAPVERRAAEPEAELAGPADPFTRNPATRNPRERSPRP